MLPMSILLSSRLAASSRKLNLLFADLSRELQKRLSGAKKLEASSRAFPVVVFRGNAVQAWIDRSQHGAVRKRRPPDGATGLVSGGRRFVRGLRRIPEIVEAHLVIQRTLKATVGLLRTAVRFLDSTRKGMTVRERLLQIAEASKNQPQGPGTLDVLLDNSKRLPRIVAAGAVGMMALADFLRALAAERGRDLVVFGEGALTLGKSMGEVFAELFPAKPGETDASSAAAPRALHETLRDVVGGITFALLALPWAGLYLGPLFKKLLLGVQLKLVDVLRGAEDLGWEFRQTVLEVFFVSLESLSRDAQDWLMDATDFVLSVLTFGINFAEIYVFELFEGLRRVTGKISEVLATISDVIHWIGIILGALYRINLVSFLPSVPGGLVVTWMDLIDAATGRRGPMSQLRESILSGKSSVGMRVEIRGLSGNVGISVVITGDKDPPTPKLSAFPALFTEMLGKGPNSLLGVLGNVLAMTKDLVNDILLVGVALLVDAERRFDSLRQDAASLDLAETFGHLGRNAEQAARRLLGPELEHLEKQGATGLERMSGILAGVLVRGGFDVVGASIRGYVLEVERFWRMEKEGEAAAAVSLSEPPTDTSPHKISRRARLGTVRVPRMTVRAQGRDLDESLRNLLVARVRRSVAEAHAAGRQRLAEARAAG